MFRKLIAGVLALLIAVQPAAAQYRPGGFVGGTRSGFQFTSGAGGYPSPGAILDDDWKNDRYAGPPVTVSNASGGYIDDAAGNWTLVPPNTARRSDKGLLVEGAQTNTIRNNSFQGAVVGQSQNAIPNSSMQGAAAGTPGNQPSNGWSMASVSSGLTRQIVGTGVENGFEYIDLRYFGTTTGSFNGSSIAYFVGGSTTPAVSGQVWTASGHVYLVGGSFANASLTIGVVEHDSAGIPIAASSTAVFSATSGPLSSRRLVVTRTLNNANTAFVSERLQLSAASGVAIDFTIRLAAPQLEQAPSAGPYTRTAGTAAAFNPGTVPNGWGILAAQNGLNFGITALTTQQGVECMDVRVFGVTTAAASSQILLAMDNTPATSGQLYSFSLFQALVAGSQANASISTDITERTSTGGLVIGNPTPLTFGAFSRVVQSVTLRGGATTARVDPTLRLSYSAGVTVDLTFRIGWPQNELWAPSVTTVGGASSPIRTTGTAATRAADVVVATLPSAVSAWTFAAVATSASFPGLSAPLAELDDGTPVNAAVLRQNATASALIGISTKSGSQAGVYSILSAPSAGTRFAVAYTQDGPSGSTAISLNGSAPSGGAVATSEQSPTSLNIVRIGSSTVVGQRWNSYIERLVIRPDRAANSNLPLLSTLQNWGG